MIVMLHETPRERITVLLIVLVTVIIFGTFVMNLI